MLAASKHRRVKTMARQTTHRAATLMFGLLTVLLLTAPVHAQDSKPEIDLQSIQLPSDPPASNGLPYNLPTGPSRAIDSLDNLFVPSLDLPVDTIGSTLFKLDLSNPNCLTRSSNCDRRSNSVDMEISKYITAKQDSGIDLVMRPRASFRFDDDSSSALVSAVVEIGEDLRRGSEFGANTWYLFAGADAEALTYSPDGIRQLSSGRFHLQDRIIVGDVQAGLGYRIGDADVSLSYLRREANAEGFSYNEDAAALSFTWKR